MSSESNYLNIDMPHSVVLKRTLEWTRRTSYEKQRQKCKQAGTAVYKILARKEEEKDF